MLPFDDDSKRMPARDFELAEVCTDRKLKAELGVAEEEQLMVAVYLPAELRDIDDDATPEQEAVALAARLRRPVAVVNEDLQLLAFARPQKSS